MESSCLALDNPGHYNSFFKQMFYYLTWQNFWGKSKTQGSLKNNIFSENILSVLTKMSI